MKDFTCSVFSVIFTLTLLLCLCWGRTSSTFESGQLLQTKDVYVPMSHFDKDVLKKIKRVERSTNEAVEKSCISASLAQYEVGNGLFGNEENIRNNVTYKASIVQRLNAHRADIEASNMQCVKWNDTLAVQAQNEANKCKYSFRTGSDIVYASSKVPEAADFVDIWISEQPRFTYPDMCSVAGGCSQYTQAVWAASSQIGCAAAKCCFIEGVRWYGGVLQVCKFGPSGQAKFGPTSWTGTSLATAPYTAGKRCQSCPENIKCAKVSVSGVHSKKKQDICCETKERQNDQQVNQLENDKQQQSVTENAALQDSSAANVCGKKALAGEKVALYRMYSSSFADHYYTTSETEQDQARSGAGKYVDEGTSGFLAQSINDSSCYCLKPLYQLYHPEHKDHYYTWNYTNVVAAQKSGFSKGQDKTNLKIQGYCVPGFDDHGMSARKGCGATKPLYKFYNPIGKDHFYTTSDKDVGHLNKNPHLMYSLEGIECYIWDK